MLLEEVEDVRKYNEDVIVQWGDGKFYKRFILRSEKKFENEKLELKNELEELKSENKWMSKRVKKYGRKEAIRVLKHMETLNGDYGEYMKHADEDDIKHIQGCCEGFME